MNELSVRAAGSTGSRTQGRYSLDHDPSTKATTPDQVTLSAEAKVLRTAGHQGAGPDYEHMTPAEMKGAAEDLFRSGEIDITQLFMLQTAGVPLGKQGPSGEFIPLTDSERAGFESTSVNYVQVAKDALRFLEKMHLDSDPKSGYSEWRGLLATLQG